MKDVHVFDDIVPDWLYRSTLNEISSIPVTFGHRGYGPNQGNVFFSSVWPNYSLHTLPWFFKATYAALESNISRLGDTVDIELNQCQLNYTTKNLTGGLHIDVNPNVASWTMVHFIGGDSGMDFWTEMPENGGEKIGEVDYKDNRCVVFPSNLLHRGLQPNLIEPRVTVGYVFSGKPPSQFAYQNNIIFPIFKDEYEKILRGEQ